MPAIRSLVALLLFGSWTGALAAQEAAAAEDPLLASLIDEALARNPDLLAAQESTRAARARPGQARALPDPMLSATYTNDGLSPTLGERDMTTLAFLWSQDLPFPGKRRLRGEIAALEADTSEEQAARARLSLAAAVERAYYGLVLARDLLDLVHEQEETWKEIEQVALARYTVGQGAQQDVLRVQVEVTRVEQLRSEQRTEAEVRLAELNRLLARPPEAPLETTVRLALRPVEGSLERRLSALGKISPELRSAALAVERDRLAVSLARKGFKPDFSVQAGYMNRGGLDPMWQAGLGISLPIYRKKLEGALAEAEARLRESERRAESARLQLRFRTQERLAQIRSAETIASLYGKGIIPQDQMSLEAAIASYQAGKVPFLAVLESLTTLYADRTTYLRVLASHEKTRAGLEEASLEATADLAAMAAPMGRGVMVARPAGSMQ